MGHREFGARPVSLPRNGVEYIQEPTRQPAVVPAEKVERKDYVHLERTYGSFARTFALPAEVQTDKARATFKDGILEIRVPKTAEAASRARKVAVE